MSGLFGGGGGSPPPPPPPPAVPPPPIMPDLQSPQVLEAQNVQTAEAMRRTGRRASILDPTTQAPGISATPYTGTTTGSAAGR